MFKGFFDKIVETKLRLFHATSCTTNITSSLNNIKPMGDTILRYPSLHEILPAELDGMKDRGFNIKDMDSISVNCRY